jgi:hypothetical protein
MVKRAALLRLCSTRDKATFFSDRSRTDANLIQFCAIVPAHGSPPNARRTSMKLPDKIESNFY